MLSDLMRQQCRLIIVRQKHHNGIHMTLKSESKSLEIFNLAALSYGIFTFLELTAWLKYIGFSSVRNGDFNILNLMTLTAAQIAIFIGGVLAIRKSRFTLHVYVTAALLGAAGTMELIFLGPAINIFTPPTPERMFLITLAALYLYSIKEQNRANSAHA